MPLKGVDVSYANGSIDWNRAKSSIDFAIIRSSFGSDLPSQIDNFFFQNVAGCEKNGIPYGLYHFAYFVDEKTAKDEAAFALRLAKECRNVRFIALDIEEDSVRYAQRVGRNPNWTSCAVAFLEKIKSAGYTPVIYTNQSWITTVFNYEKLRPYTLWYAAPGAESPRYSPSVWQYSWNGRVSGITGNVDMDLCYDEELIFGKSTSSGLKTKSPENEISQMYSAQTVNKYVIVTSKSGVNLRSGAGTSYKILGGVPYSTTVKITRVTSGGGYVWGMTAYNGITGWMALDFTKEIETGKAKDADNGKLKSGTTVCVRGYDDLKFVVSSDSGDTVIVAPKEDQTLTVPRRKIVST